MVTATRPAPALLVEDDAADAFLVAERLEQFAPGEFALDSVATLRAGIQKLASRPYAAAVLDLHLPDGSGASVWQEFQSNSAGTPLIVLTGAPDRDLETQAVQEGVQDFLLKSETNGHDLVRALKHAIARETRGASLRKQHLELMAAEARIRNLMVASAEGLAVVDRGGDVLFVNDQAARWAGLSGDVGPGVRFPLDVPIKGTRYVDVAVDESRDAVSGGLQSLRLTRLELRAVSSTWAGMPVMVVTLRDVTQQSSLTTRLTLLTQIDRSVAEAAGDAGAVCETVADLLPRLVPYQQIEIAISRLPGSPAATVLQRGIVDRIDGRSTRPGDSSEIRVSVPLGHEALPRGWMAVSSRRKDAFNDDALYVLRHVAAMISASLGLMDSRPVTA